MDLQKKHFKYEVLIFTILLLLVLNPLSSIGQEDNYFLTSEGEKVIMHPSKDPAFIHSRGDVKFTGDHAFSAQFLYYLDDNSNVQKVAHKDVKEVRIHDAYYIAKPIKGDKGPIRLHQVIASNDTYILTMYYDGVFYAYIFNQKTDKCESSKVKVGYSKKNDIEYLNTVIKPKFSSCDELLSQLKKHSSGKDRYPLTRNKESNFFKDISNIQCAD